MSSNFHEGRRKLDVILLLLKELYKEVKLRILLLVVLAGIVGAILIWTGYPPRDEFSRYVRLEIGKALLITACLSFAVQWIVRKPYDKLIALTKDVFGDPALIKLKDLCEEARKRMEERWGKSLHSLQNAGIDRVYFNRSEASNEIEVALTEPGNGPIQIMGISLNDFVARPDAPAPLSSAWTGLMNCVANDTPPNGASKLDIQVLLIDKRSEGAYLRSKAEEGLIVGDSQLDSDLDRSMNDCKNAISMTKSKNRKQRVTFQARVYRTTPTLFLVRTPSVSFFQQYYFRHGHNPKVSMPVLRSVPEHPLHSELDFHFNWIWDHAAIDLMEYVDRYSYGTDMAIRQSRVSNIYYDPGIEPKPIMKRLVKMIKETKEILWIKGISLKLYCDERFPLKSSIVDACNRGVDVRILLINPDGEQAKYRAFREWLITHPNGNLTFDQFTDTMREDGRLYRDTQQSIHEFREMKTLLGISGKKVPEIRIFDSAAEAYVLITDHSAFVEQYNYGYIKTEEANLTGEVPLLEYSKGDPEDKMDPYRVFRDHYEFVFKHGSKQV